MPPQGRRCRLPCCCAPPLDWPEEADTTYRSSGGGYACGRRRGSRGLLAEVHQEQRLVDAALEDRHAHLHALLDHLTALQTGFAGELRGREVDCHRCCPPMEFALCVARYRVVPTVSTAKAQHGLNICARRGFGMSTKTCSIPKRSARCSPRRRTPKVSVA